MVVEFLTSKWRALAEFSVLRNNNCPLNCRQDLIDKFLYFQIGEVVLWLSR